MKRHPAIGLIAASAVIGAGGAAAVAHGTHQDAHPVATPASAPTVSMSATPMTTPPSPASTAKASTSLPTLGNSGRPLGVDNLLHTSDLSATGFEPDKSSATTSGDAQYAITPCLQSALGGVTGENVFSGSWYDDPSNAVSESISEAYTAAQAKTFATKIERWHRGACTDGFRVGRSDRRTLPDGWIHEFEITDSGGDFSYAAVILRGDRIAVLGFDTAVVREDRANAVFDAAADRLR